MPPASSVCSFSVLVNLIIPLFLSPPPPACHHGVTRLLCVADKCSGPNTVFAQDRGSVKPYRIHEWIKSNWRKWTTETLKDLLDLELDNHFQNILEFYWKCREMSKHKASLLNPPKAMQQQQQRNTIQAHVHAHTSARADTRAHTHAHILAPRGRASEISLSVLPLLVT